LTDAGLTTHRAIKKVKSVLGPGKSIGIIGMGGLGSYAIQYAKILSSASSVLAFDINDDKLTLAKQNGADHIINIKGKKAAEVLNEVSETTGRKEIDVVLDTVGSDEIGL
jgi:alcohol dehydrogenase, propanol-preferring